MKRKWLGIFSTLILVLTMFIAVFYIAAEADHHCTGDDCPICQVIHTAQGLLTDTGKTTVHSGASLQLPMQILLLLPLVFRPMHSFFYEDTLISEKIRFNN